MSFSMEAAREKKQNKVALPADGRVRIAGTGLEKRVELWSSPDGCYHIIIYVDDGIQGLLQP